MQQWRCCLFAPHETTAAAAGPQPLVYRSMRQVLAAGAALLAAAAVLHARGVGRLGAAAGFCVGAVSAGV